MRSQLLDNSLRKSIHHDAHRGQYEQSKANQGKELSPITRKNLQPYIERWTQGHRSGKYEGKRCDQAQICGRNGRMHHDGF
eukprot:scaffold54964_cov30-Tisochrysis_lutea.AAC.4